ncbi:MAG: membrane protein insertase YidC [Alteromonadaceae bacterium]|nr:membrane protein insertase YidC [Alteromonadaceae bacterium]
MESQRSILIIAIAFISYLLWQQWHADYGPQPVQPISQQQTDNGPTGVPSASSVPASNSTDEDVPVAVNDSLPQAPVNSGSQQNYVTVQTDTLNVTINLVGGDVVHADLVKFPVTQGADELYSLLRANAGLYVAQSGLVGQDGPDGSAQGRPLYQASATSFTLTGDTLSVPLTWSSNDGIIITKTFTFSRDHNDVDVSYTISNNSGRTATFQQYAQLKQTIEEAEGGNMFMPTYRGAAYSTADNRYKKYSFDDIEDDKLRISTTGGWVGMLEHYFVSAWVPPQSETNSLYSRMLNGQYAIIGYTGKTTSVESGQATELSSTLYLGPKDQDKLAKLAPGLDLTVDYGILFWISQPLFALLQFLHSLVGNWGVAIILITIIVKGAMYWLTKKQYESMAKMRNLAPKMQQLKDRFGDDRQKMSQAMMELYKKEKVNPMGGCFPLLLQMPIFLALYWVLLESVELRHADFVLWITDLSVKDPYFVLPVLTGLSMYLLQKLQPTTMTDPMQQKIMQFMPVAMSIFFIWFPAGLVLYWLVSNVITLIQAKIIYASMEKRGIK